MGNLTYYKQRGGPFKDSSHPKPSGHKIFLGPIHVPGIKNGDSRLRLEYSESRYIEECGVPVTAIFKNFNSPVPNITVMFPGTIMFFKIQ